MSASNLLVHSFVPAFGAIYSTLPILEAFQAFCFGEIGFEFLASFGINFSEGIWVINVPSK